VGVYSVVIHTKPENLQSVTDKISLVKGVEVHGSSDKGKLVVSLEHPDRGYCSETLMSFHNIPGVLNSSLIYEYCGDEDELSEELATVSDTRN